LPESQEGLQQYYLGPEIEDRIRRTRSQDGELEEPEAEEPEVENKKPRLEITAITALYKQRFKEILEFT
jgi:hypothetical protein